MRLLNLKNTTVFKYPPYMYNGAPATAPKHAEWVPRQVVYNESKNTLGVLLGCIDVINDECRTDMDGMVYISDLRVATMEDFNIEGVTYHGPLFLECSGYNVIYNWGTSEFKLGVPKIYNNNIWLEIFLAVGRSYPDIVLSEGIILANRFYIQHIGAIESGDWGEILSEYLKLDHELAPVTA